MPKKARKSQGCWHSIEIPVYALIAWNALSVLISAYNIISVMLIGVLGSLVTVACFGYIGNCTRDCGIKYSAKAGAFAGLIAGFAAAIIGIFSFYSWPHLYEPQIQQALEAGAPESTVRMFMTVGVYAGLVVSPAIMAGIGAAISAFFAWVTRNT